MGDRREKIATFMEVTGLTDHATAQQYLEASNWDLGDAIQTATCEESSFELPERADASAPPAADLDDSLIVDDDINFKAHRDMQANDRFNVDDDDDFHDAVGDDNPLPNGSGGGSRRRQPNRFSPLAVDDVAMPDDTAQRASGSLKSVGGEKSNHRVSSDSDVVFFSPKVREKDGKRDVNKSTIAGSSAAFRTSFSSAPLSSSSTRVRSNQPLAAGESSSVLPSSSVGGRSDSSRTKKPVEVSVADDDDDDSDEEITDEDEVISINDDALNGLLRPPSPKTASRSSASPKYGGGESSSAVGGGGGLAHKTEFIPALAPAEGPTIELFRNRFTEVYGDKAEPLFFIGSLQEAMSEAFESRSADSRRMLAVYLHNVRSVAVNVFVNNTLLDDEVINLIAQHYVLWPWDCTAPENRVRFDALLTHLIPSSAHGVQQYPEDAFPYLLIFDKHKAQVVELMVISGHLTKVEVVHRLINCVQMHETFVHQDEQEEIQRVQRLEEREEMNKAFEESLAADRAKEQQKRDDERRARELEQSRLEQIRLAELERKKMEEELMPEPPLPTPGSKAADDVVVIRIRTPESQNLVRRFYRSQPLGDLIKFAHAKGYSVAEYSLKTQYPSRDLSQLDGQMLLSDLKLGKTENVFVEQR